MVNLLKATNIGTLVEIERVAKIRRSIGNQISNAFQINYPLPDVFSGAQAS